MSPKELAALLEEHGIDPRNWEGRRSRRGMNVLLRQLHDKEVHLHSRTSLHPTTFGRKELVMESEVVALRIYCGNPIQPGIRLFLIEYVWDDSGTLAPRLKNAGSVSGSMRESEKPHDTFLREIEEELGIIPEPEECVFADLVNPVTPDEATSTRFPPIISAKKAIYHGSWEMPGKYYKPAYLERETRSVRSPVKGAFVWWPMAFWDLKQKPPKFDSLRELMDHFAKPVGAI